MENDLYEDDKYITELIKKMKEAGDFKGAKKLEQAEAEFQAKREKRMAKHGPNFTMNIRSFDD